MKTEHTLRYLLLRHLKKLERRVPRDLFLEVTRSLHVAVDRHSYVVTWQARGERHEKTFPRGAFAFYARGDTEASKRDEREDLHTENDALASAFAEEALGSPPAAPASGAREPLEPYVRVGVVEAAALGAGALTVGGLGAWNAIGLAALLLVEFGRDGRLRSALLFLPLAAWGPSVAAALGALAYSSLQFLDPDPTRRSLRVALSLLATGLALSRAAAPDFGWSLLPLAFLAVAVVLARSLLASHLRAVPLALPFYALGLGLDGYAAAALSILAVVGGGTLATAFIHAWSPLQRERSLTPNG
jgi:hypothetical protein